MRFLLVTAATIATTFAATAQVQLLTGPPTFISPSDEQALRTGAAEHCRLLHSVEKERQICAVVQQQYILLADAELAAYARVEGAEPATAIRSDCWKTYQEGDKTDVRPFMGCIGGAVHAATAARCSVLLPDGDPRVSVEERARCYANR